MEKKIDRAGETRLMGNGMMATIVRYPNAKDIDVLFSDGTLVKHKRYNDFKNGKIANPSYNPGFEKSKNAHLGEIRMMHCGMLAKITDYKKATDLEVTFEDGAVVNNKQYDDFCNGYIAHPKYPYDVNKRIYLNLPIKRTIPPVWERKKEPFNNKEQEDFELEK